MGTFRLLLALTILLGHVYAINGWLDLGLFHLLGSPIAFESFFLVSGFTIAMAVNEKYPAGPEGYRVFVSNRLLRIYPLYWLFLIVTVVTCLIFQKTTGDALILQPLLDAWNQLDLGTTLWVLLSNVFILGQDLAFFTGLDTGTGRLFFTEHFMQMNPQVNHLLLISQAWALAFLIVFYFLAPWLTRKRAGYLILLIAITQGWRLFFYQQGFFAEPWMYRFFPFEFGMILLGVLSYKLYPSLKKIHPPAMLNGIFFLIFIALSVFYDRIEWWPYWQKQWSFYALLFFSMPLLFAFSRDRKWDRFLGELSLPVYFGNFLLIHVMKKTTSLSPPVFTILCVASVMLMAVMVWFIFLRPLEAVRRRNVSAAFSGTESKSGEEK